MSINSYRLASRTTAVLFDPVWPSNPVNNCILSSLCHGVVQNQNPSPMCPQPSRTIVSWCHDIHDFGIHLHGHPYYILLKFVWSILRKRAVLGLKKLRYGEKIYPINQPISRWVWQDLKEMHFHCITDMTTP